MREAERGGKEDGRHTEEEESVGYVKYCCGHGFIFLQIYLFLYTTLNKVVSFNWKGKLY